METATSQMLKRDESERARMISERMMESFLNRWKPEDKYDASEFEVELFSLVRQIYHDAQEPLAKQLLMYAQAMPFISPNTSGK